MIETKIVQTSDNFVGFEEKEWGTEAYGIVLQNGTSALLAYNPNCKSRTYDTNGKKLPNAYGKDLNGDMAGKAFWVKINDTLKITAADVSYTPVGGNYWQGAKNACEAIDGGGVARLPKGGLSNPNWGWFDKPVGTLNTVGAKSTVQPSSGEAYEIWKWCKTNTCSGSYWLEEAWNSTIHYGLFGSQLGFSGQSDTVTVLSVRCVKK